MKKQKKQKNPNKKGKEFAKQTRRPYLNTIKYLAMALEGRDIHTQGHSIRVAQYSLLVGEQLFLPGMKMEKLHLACLLHDIGNIGVKQDILSKPEHLTPEEYEEVKIHPILSMKILRPLISDVEVIKTIKHHHERWDGKGYPDGLKGMEIPLSSRIILACDTFDAMTSDRPYREALANKIAFKRLKKCSANQLDPYVIKAFFKIEKEKLNEIQNLSIPSFISLLGD